MGTKSLFFLATYATFISIVLSGCSSNDIPGTKLTSEYRDIEFSPAQATVAKNQNEFSIKFFSQMAELEADSAKNLMVSPLSAEIALSILANTVDESTSTELLALLGQSDLDGLNSYNTTLMNSLPIANDSTKLSLANSVWITDQVSIPESYSTMFYETFGDYPQSLDFSNGSSAKKIINDWSADRTNGLIEKICPNNITKMQILFANALYFSSSWHNVFDPKDTKPGNFSTPFSTPTVSMMKGHFEVPAFEDGGTKSIKLYFHEKRYAMTLVLPEKGESAIELAKDIEKLSSILTSEYTLHSYDIRLPKFSISGGFDMITYLKKNLPDFWQGSWDKCGFDSTLKYYTLVQHTKFSVHEKGAEAATVTNSDWLSAFVPYSCEFIADRPFIFVVTEEKTGTVILAGIINDPTLEDGDSLNVMD